MHVYVHNPTIFWALNHNKSYKNINGKALQQKKEKKKKEYRGFIINACLYAVCVTKHQMEMVIYQRHRTGNCKNNTPRRYVQL